MRTGVEDLLARGFEELAVHTVHGFCARLLHDEALEAGLDPFVTPVSAADRLAMLLEHVDELTLRVHDFRGNPAALLADVIARIDRLKAAMITAPEYARWAAALGDGDESAEREREFAAVYEDHDRMLAAQGALDAGDLVLHAHALVRDRPHVRARAAARHRHLLVDDVQDLEHAALRLVVLLAAAAADAGGHGSLTAAGRRRPGHPAPARRGGQEPARPRARPARRADRAPGALAALPGARRGGRGRRRRAAGRPDRQAPGGAGGRQRALLARRGRARTGAGGGRRRRAARARRRAGRRGRRARALRARRGPGRRARARGARGAPPPGRRHCVLPARGGQGRAGLAAAARRPVRRRRRGPRAGPAADRAALGRPRPLRAHRPPAQARHGRRAGRRDGVARSSRPRRASGSSGS